MSEFKSILGEFLSEPHSGQESLYGQKSKEYFFEFAQKFFASHPSDFQILEHFGLTERHGENEAVNYDGVLRHSVTEALLSDTLAEKLGVSESGRELLVRACMLHDSFRRERGEMYDRYNGGRSAEEELFDPNAHQGREVLRKRGISPEILDLMQFMHSSGMFKMDFSNLEEQTESELIQKIFWYIDSSLDNVKLLPLAERVQRFRDREAGIDQLGYKLTNAKGESLGMSLFDFYIDSGKKFEKFLEQKLEIQKPNTVIDFLTNLLKQKIQE